LEALILLPFPRIGFMMRHLNSTESRDGLFTSESERRSGVEPSGHNKPDSE